MELLNSKNLLKEFEVKASFYKMEVEKEYYTCRNQARLLRKGFALNSSIDAVFLLVNPGACSASDQSYDIPVLVPTKETIPFVDAKSDQTQWQLMRLMKLKQWNHTAIINLSDICSGNINVFLKTFKLLQSKKKYEHSILFCRRKKELEALLNQNNGPVIAGWGTNSSIRKIAEEALKHPLLQNITGINYRQPPYFLHPRPALMENRRIWLKKMSSLIG
ncbi:hypothetical protein [Sutcliffiella deserti]|uniref:hypothetical protein n=1 Tax=Sutcliffiella deserti TaxID=2875501 RepID=UPI001CBEA197|nr:hypothetical protein [Sutcliffiella deserti]